MSSTQGKKNSTETDELTGRILRDGEYQIQRVLGLGGMGKVYLATHTTLKVPFALKQARADQPLPESVINELNHALHMGDITQRIPIKQPEPDFPCSGGLHTDRFLREALLLARLQHTAIPTLYDYFFQDGYWYLVMDYIPGPTLSAYLREQAPLLTLEALNYAMQLCDVLDYLHKQAPPIIFRDLKPSNIILAPNGSLMLVDFGIARYYKPGQVNDTTEFGSPGYASPEQYEGEGQTDGRSDLFSLGVILHEMTTGKRPAGVGVAHTLHATLERIAPSGSALLSGLVNLATRSEPMYRFQSAHAFYLALERAYILEERRSYQQHIFKVRQAPGDHGTAEKSRETTPETLQSKAGPAQSFPSLELSQRLQTRETLHQTRQERQEREHLEIQLASVDESLKRRSFVPLSQAPALSLEELERKAGSGPTHKVRRVIQISFIVALLLFLVMASLLAYARYWHHPSPGPQDQQIAMPTITAETNSSWQMLPSLPSAEADNTALYVEVQGRAYIYMTGGFRSQKQPPNYDHGLYRYDVAVAHWEAVPNGALPGMINNAAVQDGQGHLFFTAGYSTDSYAVTSALYMYQLSDGAVQRITPPAQIAIGFGGAMVADQQGHLYITQGFMKGGDPLAQADTGWYRYDIATSQWHQLAPMPTELGYMILTLDNNGGIISMGGAADAAQHNQSNKIYRYNINNDSWTQVQATTPLPLSGAASCQDQPGQVIVVGGYDATHDKGLAQSWLVDLSTFHWTLLEPLPLGGSILGAAACDEAGHVFMERGANDQYHPTPDFWEMALPEIQGRQQ
ncbi:MAG TPA: protein kinase [Ktedonosporobacter sp.]|nr:protein kinase [Ktedonosporobacter sp.]